MSDVEYPDDIDLTATRAVGESHGGDKLTEAIMPNVIDRFHEALYFYELMLDEYHNPWHFRFNLNACLQALRSVTFMLQSEPDKPAGLEDWYKAKAQEISKNPLFVSINNARVIIVHQRSLVAESSADIGLFKYYTPKLYVSRQISPFLATEDILKHAEAFAKFYEPGVFVGEQLGVARKWVVTDLGPNEAASYCRIALAYMNQLIDECYHEFYDRCFPPHLVPSPWPSRIYFETDANPELGEQWGWAPPPIGPQRRRPRSEAERERLRIELDEFLARILSEGVDGAVAADDAETQALVEGEPNVDVPEVLDSENLRAFEQRNK